MRQFLSKPKKNFKFMGKGLSYLKSILLSSLKAGVCKSPINPSKYGCKRFESMLFCPNPQTEPRVRFRIFLQPNLNSRRQEPTVGFTSVRPVSTRTVVVGVSSLSPHQQQRPDHVEIGLRELRFSNHNNHNNNTERDLVGVVEAAKVKSGGG